MIEERTKRLIEECFGDKVCSVCGKPAQRLKDRGRDEKKIVYFCVAHYEVERPWAYVAREYCTIKFK